MEIKRVCAAYFSGTGTTKKITSNLAKSLSDKLGVSLEIFDFTLPLAREKGFEFKKDDLVVFGTPTIAGRVPNLLLKYLKTLNGNGAITVPIVLYGNRNYDDSLIELRDILDDGNFKPIAAGAFIGEHSFSKILGKGRPDNQDMLIVENFANKIFEKLKTENKSLVEVNGTPKPYRWYYQPKDKNGNVLDIRKVKPITNNNCTNCKVCAQICPMGSILFDDVRAVVGICIKCCACIKKCPENAKYFDDPNYNYHKMDLEEKYTRRAEPEIFL